MAAVRPFVKWVGGKSQLLKQIETFLPPDFSQRTNITYVEPFVGGGAMLFHMLQKYKNIEHAVINDINPDLTACYKTVRDCPEDLICSLTRIQEEYYGLAEEERKRYYLLSRDRFNQRTDEGVERTALFFFLNRTCFNGLYRVNKSGKFNVPPGRYKRPMICDAETILADSGLLRKVIILEGDFEQTLEHRGDNSFFYFDPPYRPVSKTSNFKSYAKEAFDDEAQIRLKLFCDRLHAEKIPFMLSNSDGKGTDGNDSFLEDLYCSYSIRKVWAARSVNSVASKRGKLTEILVTNY